MGFHFQATEEPGCGTERRKELALMPKKKARMPLAVDAVKITKTYNKSEVNMKISNAINRLDIQFLQETFTLFRDEGISENDMRELIEITTTNKDDRKELNDSMKSVYKENKENKGL